MIMWVGYDQYSHPACLRQFRSSSVYFDLSCLSRRFASAQAFCPLQHSLPLRSRYVKCIHNCTFAGKKIQKNHTDAHAFSRLGELVERPTKKPRGNHETDSRRLPKDMKERGQTNHYGTIDIRRGYTTANEENMGLGGRLKRVS